MLSLSVLGAEMFDTVDVGGPGVLGEQSVDVQFGRGARSHERLQVSQRPEAADLKQHA